MSDILETSVIASILTSKFSKFFKLTVKSPVPVRWVKLNIDKFVLYWNKWQLRKSGYHKQTEVCMRD